MQEKAKSFYSSSIWFLCGALYLIFIFIFCYLYPLGGDEYHFYPMKFEEIIEGFFLNYLTICGRIGMLFDRIFLFLGKDVFNFFAPLLQLLLVILSFYTIFLRLPNLKNLKDLPAFLLLMFLTVFAVAQPDNNVFWMGGVSNYNWPFLLFLPFLAAGRLLVRGNSLPALDKKYSLILVCLLGFCLGSGGETFGPLCLMWAGALILYLKLTKRFLPQWLKFITLAIIIGLVFFFLSPGLRYRSSHDSYNFFFQLSLFERILRHIPLMLKICIYNFFLFPISVIIIAVCFFKGGGKNKLYTEDFLFPISILILSLAAASALALAPILNMRPFYPATLLSIIAFVYSLDLLRRTFGLDLYRYVFYIVFIYAVVILPLYIPSFILLHNQDIMRQDIIRKAIAAGKKEVYLTHFITTKGPFDNMTVYFYDSPMNMRSKYDITTQPADTLEKGQAYIKQY